MTQMCLSEIMPDTTELVMYEKNIKIYSPESYDSISIRFEHLPHWIAALTHFKEELDKRNA